MEEIYLLLRDRDPEGAKQLLERFGPLMRYVIRPILPVQEDLEDCLQEVLLQVWDKIGGFDPEKGSFPAWLTAVTRNTALNRARRTANGVEQLHADLPHPDPGPEELLLLEERRLELARAINELFPKEKQLFYRKYYYRQPTAQIAAEMGLTERAVEGKLYRIRKRLRHLLGGDDHG